MIGRLCFADVYEVSDTSRLEEAPLVGRVVESACRLGGATVIATHAHAFEPQGLTLVTILAESHAAIHTYPEESAYMVDVFTCGEIPNPWLIVESIVHQLGGTARFGEQPRGRII